MCVIPYSSVFTTTAPQLEFQNFNIYYYYYYTYIRNHILLVGKNCMEVLLSRKMVQIKGFPCVGIKRCVTGHWSICYSPKPRNQVHNLNDSVKLDNISHSATISPTVLQVHRPRAGPGQGRPIFAGPWPWPSGSGQSLLALAPGRLGPGSGLTLTPGRLGPGSGPTLTLQMFLK